MKNFLIQITLSSFCLILFSICGYPMNFACEKEDFNELSTNKQKPQLFLIKSLNLVKTNITDKGLAHLKNLTSLTSLDLRDCQNITDDGLACLPDLKCLTSLNLSYCPKITNKGLIHMNNLAHLTSLNIKGFSAL